MISYSQFDISLIWRYYNCALLALANNGKDTNFNTGKNYKCYTEWLVTTSTIINNVNRV